MEMTQFGEVKKKDKQVPNQKRVNPAFGIDLGTTNSCIAVVGNGNRPEILPLAGKITIPSCVMWIGEDKFVVGREAYERRGESNVIYSVKRLMGSSTRVTLTYKGESREFEPWEISREILKALVYLAKQGIYREISDVCITVPAYFTNTQIEETKKAAEAAGLNILGIQKEPTAAALIYNQETSSLTSKKVLIYDLGGGTFDVSVIMISKQQDTELDDLYGLSSGEDKVLFSVLKVLGDMKLGGDDVDHLLMKIIMDRMVKHGVKTKDYDQETKEKILLKAEKFKKMGIAAYREKMTINGKETELALNPNDFINAFDVIYQKTKRLMDEVINHPVVGGHIDQIITVGGSTKSEVIQESLRRDYPDVPLNTSMNPDESVALGAAIQAKRAKFGDDSINILDCLAMNIGLLSEGYISSVLKAGDQIPCTNWKTFLTEEVGQDGADLDVYQGLTRYPEECTYLGTLKLSNLDTKADKVGRIYLELSVDSNGLLSISAESGNSGLQKLELVNILGAKKQNLETDARVVRWRRFIEGLEEGKKNKGLALLEQFTTGAVSGLEMSTFIKENKKAVKSYTTNIKVAPTSVDLDGSEE